jgi:hypothetical protein
MFNRPFYFSLIRKYTTLIGALFDDIYIQRFDKDGNETELLKVPLSYIAKDKMLARVMQDPAIDRPTATLPLPMISFELGQMRYDGPRKLPTTGKSAVMDTTNPDNFLRQYNPVPYNIDYKVYIYTKNVEDGNKILEQVIPFFTPDWTTSLKLIPEMNITMDIPVILNGLSYSDNYDKAYDERRAIIWALDLNLKGWFFGPIKSKPVIKFSKMSYYMPLTPNLQDGVGNTAIAGQVIISPGLTANGQPTSNAAQSIPVTEIEASSDYGYITEANNG